MSDFIATVANIESCDGLNIVSFDYMGQMLSMMSLNINNNIQIGMRVKLIAKPSHIAIAKEFSGDISYSNKLPATITSVKNGQLLSSIKLNFLDTTLESIITLNSSQKMHLKVGDRVTAFIKASELSISEIVDD